MRSSEARAARRGGLKVDDELVAPGADRGPQVEAVGAVLVLCPPELGAVQRDRGDGVQPFGEQIDALMTGIDEIERCAVPGVALGDPLHVALVQVQVGVGDEARGEEVGVHRTGHGRRNHLR